MSSQKYEETLGKKEEIRNRVTDYQSQKHVSEMHILKGSRIDRLNSYCRMKSFELHFDYTFLENSQKFSSRKPFRSKNVESECEKGSVDR